MAVLLLAFTLQGCQAPSASPHASANPAEVARVPLSAKEGIASDAPAPIPEGKAIVAPLFNHGEGRASYGCVVVAQPVFLSEEDAWSIIDEELAKRGIRLDEKDRIIPGIRIPLYDSMALAGMKEGDPLPSPTSIEALKADRTNSRKRIALEFISNANPPEKAAQSNEMEFSSLGTVDFAGGASSLLKKVSEGANEQVYFGALYDPVVHARLEQGYSRPSPDSLSREQQREEWERNAALAEAKARSEAHSLLRKQVRDFIRWLEKKGAL